MYFPETEKHTFYIVDLDTLEAVAIFTGTTQQAESLLLNGRLPAFHVVSAAKHPLADNAENWHFDGKGELVKTVLCDSVSQ